MFTVIHNVTQPGSCSIKRIVLNFGSPFHRLYLPFTKQQRKSFHPQFVSLILKADKDYLMGFVVQRFYSKATPPQFDFKCAYSRKTIGQEHPKNLINLFFNKQWKEAEPSFYPNVEGHLFRVHFGLSAYNLQSI